MKPCAIFVLTVFLASGALVSAAAPAALTVAVYDFKGEAEAASYGNKVTALVTADLTTETNLVMLERAELSQALNEEAFGISGLVSSDAAAKIGALTGAKILVSGEIIATEHKHLILVATIIGTETGRLFSAKTEGAADNLLELTSDLSTKIAQTINGHTTNFLAPEKESSAERLERIVKSITGAKRPSVSIDIQWSHRVSRKSHLSPSAFHSLTAEDEFGSILLKAGFPVVDAHSDRKADVEIRGVQDHSEGPGRGELFSFRSVIELKVQERPTGNIIAIDRQESIATDATKVGADRAAQVQAVDDLAERILPLLAK